MNLAYKIMTFKREVEKNLLFPSFYIFAHCGNNNLSKSKTYRQVKKETGNLA